MSKFGGRNVYAFGGVRKDQGDTVELYPTPPWATRAFLDACPLVRPGDKVWEPCCGGGHMARVLEEWGADVCASDLYWHGYGDAGRDALTCQPPWRDGPDAIITNPPFSMALDMVKRWLTIAPTVAVLVRSSWGEGVKRYEQLFKDRPPFEIYQYVERVPMTKGAYRPDASTATSYAWFVWGPACSSVVAPSYKWIPPGQKKKWFRGRDVKCGA